MAIIELQEITKSYGTFDALREVNLSVAAGEVTCVLGDNERCNAASRWQMRCSGHCRASPRNSRRSARCVSTSLVLAAMHVNSARRIREASGSSLVIALPIAGPRPALFNKAQTGGIPAHAISRRVK